MGHRILTVVHGHPDLSRGGGERSSYTLFQGYRHHPAVEDAWFLARVDLDNGPTGRLHLRRPGEYLVEQAVRDFFEYASVNRDAVRRGFHELIETLSPTVVHFHHFIHLGLDYIAHLKTHFPDVLVLFTPHEYTLICPHNGQMVKTGSLSLCNAWGLLDCHGCFPERRPEEFWLRYRRLLAHMEHVDHFVVPSRFLRDRLAAWGLPEEKMSVLENGLSAEVCAAAAGMDEETRERRDRFGFFGQVNPYKGLDVLLAGAARAVEDGFDGFTLEVNGAYLDRQEQALQDRVARLRKPLDEAGVLKWTGPYEPHELPRRMRGIDWVCVPSVWWENSPVVIQEAFAHGRPVVCSDIGGMAEKVRDGIDGVHVPVGDVRGWAETFRRLAGDGELWTRLRAGIRPPMDGEAAAARHVEIIDTLTRAAGTVRLAG